MRPFDEMGGWLVKRKMRPVCTALLSALAALLCTGCSFRFVASPEDLYTLPNLPAEYTRLNSRIQQLLNSGMEYAAPLSGVSTQNVQLMDLDGDGSQEAIVFLRNSAEEQPLRIHIFTAEQDDYRQAAVIAGSGSEIYSFNARDLDADGRPELLVGWETGTETRALSVYSLDGKPQELLRIGYARYSVEDLTGDGLRELVVFRTDDQGCGIADLYVWNAGLEKRAEARLSVSMVELERGGVVFGALSDGTPALFTTGVMDDASVTDVLCVQEGRLANITVSPYTGMTTEIFRYRELAVQDIDRNGTMDVPAAVTLPNVEGDGGEYCRIDWSSYDPDGVRIPGISTYHNPEKDWYLELPAAWKNEISVSRTTSGDGETAVTFYRRGDAESPLLRICTIGGANREQTAVRGNRIILSRQADVIYTAELLAGNVGWGGSVTEDELRGSFRLVYRTWEPGAN